MATSLSDTDIENRGCCLCDSLMRILFSNYACERAEPVMTIGKPT